jgi:NADH-quinone oxidoreductase subunit H
MILISFLAAIMFLGGWLSPFQGFTDGWLASPGIGWLMLKAVFFAFCYVWFRASFPRYRYDQIMRLGWKVFIPITIVWILVAAWAVHAEWFVAGA